MPRPLLTRNSPRTHSRKTGVSVNLCSARYNENLWQNRHNRDMKSNLPILPAVVAILIGGSSSVSQTPVKDPTSPNPQRLLRKAAETLFEATSLEANVSQDVNLIGQTLTGFGKYRQLGQGRGRAWLSLRLLAKGKQVGRLEQICTGETLYTRIETPQRKRLSYVSLGQVRKAIAASANPSKARTKMQWMAHGGLAGLLLQINDSFRFGPPRVDFLEAKSSSESNLRRPNNYRIPVWVLVGEWRPSMLKQLLPKQKEAIKSGESVDLDQLPEHVPHRVELILGNDAKFPLFPYKITYLRKTKEESGDPISNAYTPIVALRFFMLRNRLDLGPNDFQYQLMRDPSPGASGTTRDDVQQTDQTRAFIRRLGIEPAK